MDIATEEFSHLEIVGATITMLLNGVNGDLKNAAEQSEIMQLQSDLKSNKNVFRYAGHEYSRDDVKQDLSRINHANLSVCVSDAFMEAVKEQDRAGRRRGP